MAVRAVVDTNVIVAGLRSRRGSSFRLLQLLGDPRWRPCLSVPLVLEYEDVLKREFMDSILGEPDVDPLLEYLFEASDIFEVEFRLRLALRDPDDDRIVELAACARAAIITFNTRDFAGAGVYGVPVVKPVEFLRKIGELR